MKGRGDHPDVDDFDDEDDEPARDAPPDRVYEGSGARGFEDPVDSYDDGEGDE